MPSPALRARRASLSLIAVAATFAAILLSSSAVAYDPFSALEYRHIGPVGNRVISVAGVAGDPNTYYAGAASGGVWKTADGGVTWRPIFDDQPASSIGALAVAPSDPNVVWVGTGETFIRANISIGNGVYRSTDAGATWTHLGLEASERIGRIVVHPNDPDTAYVAALGSIYGPNEERGVFRTHDGGATWEPVLSPSPRAGAIDLVMDPNNPRILFAALWQIELNTWSRTSGGPDSGLWTSRDGGDTWARLEGGGLPTGPWGKIGLGMSAADSRRIYALVETSTNHDFAPSDPFQGVLWRSDDGGEDWEMVSADNDLVQRPLYYSRLAVSPTDADTLYFMAVRHSTSLDGGKTNFATPEQPGWDHHVMWIAPDDAQRMIVGHDGGVSVSTNGGETWLRPQLPIAQMYHVAVDDQVPYFVYGNRQDGPTFRGPSNTLDGDTIPLGAWQSVGGCEVGFALPTPGDPDVVWSGCYDGILERYDHRSGHARTVSVWPEAIESWPAIDLRYRFQWTFPMAISPHEPETVYVGSQYVHRTRDAGQSWQVISPDLTSNDPELQQRTGGLTLDDAGPTLAPTLFALAESEREPGVLWTGSNDGLVQVSRDGGDSWTDVTPNLPADLPTRGTISNVEPSHHRDGAVYLTVDRHQLGDTATWVFASDDYGATWRSLRGDLPQDTFSYAHCVREDPEVPGLLYLGTENGVWISFDDGAHWQALRSNLPHTPVHWLTVQEHFSDLVVGTYGRGFWILDDLTPIRRLARSGETLGDGPLLLAPRPTYRFRRREQVVRHPVDNTAGKNPPYGALIHYMLGGETGDTTAGVEEGGDEDGGGEDGADTEGGTTTADATGTDIGGNDDGPSAANAGDLVEDTSTENVGAEPVLTESSGPRLTILDSAGDVVRTLDDIPAGPGLHRVVWDLEGEATTEVKLRTRPLENPLIPLGDEGWRPLSDGGELRLLAPPGTYTVRLEAGGQSFEQSLEVLRDPRSAGTARDLERQGDVLDELWTLIDRAARWINEIEWVRRQLRDRRERFVELAEQSAVLDEVDSLEALGAASEELEEKLIELEGRFFDLRLTGTGQDSLRWKRLLYSRMIYLAYGIAKTDHRPTDAQQEVFELYHSQMTDHGERFEALRAEVAAFSDRVQREGHGGIQLGGVPGSSMIGGAP